MPAPLLLLLTVLLGAPLSTRADNLIVLLDAGSCPNCKLADADLVHADLSHTNLNAADLRRANLSRARLDGADLRNEDLCFSNLKGASLKAATYWAHGWTAHNSFQCLDAIDNNPLESLALRDI